MYTIADLSRESRAKPYEIACVHVLWSCFHENSTHVTAPNIVQVLKQQTWYVSVLFPRRENSQDSTGSMFRLSFGTYGKPIAADTDWWVDYEQRFSKLKLLSEWSVIWVGHSSRAFDFTHNDYCVRCPQRLNAPVLVNKTYYNHTLNYHENLSLFYYFSPRVIFVIRWKQKPSMFFYGNLSLLVRQFGL